MHKRKLLLIYIHGFLGSEDSFHQFPRHVHDHLTITLAETHAVFTKIYPRYQSRGPMKVARNNFSQWLSHHESSCLDVVLLGHSLGGFVAAEVALMSLAETAALKHRILGLVNFDVPFLGVHPRVVSTGIGRLFRSKRGSGYEQPFPLEENSRPLEQEVDAKFDPAFSNDVNMPQWKGWDGARHFLSKYSRKLSRSILQYGFSYYDHAGCLNNYPALLKRHARLCQLEEMGDLHPNHRETSQGVRRVRFLNYFTFSSNRATSYVPRAYHERWRSEHATTRMAPRTSSAEFQILSRPSNETFEEETLAKDSTSSMYSSDEKLYGSSKNRTAGRKFCLLPRSCKDHLWVPLHMEAADEIVAHQSVFLMKSSHYDHLVRDTVARIENWIQDELTQQVILSRKF